MPQTKGKSREGGATVEEHLEGQMNGMDLVLVGTDSGRVYSSLRDKRGKLVEIGSVVDGNIVLSDVAPKKKKKKRKRMKGDVKAAEKAAERGGKKKKCGKESVRNEDDDNDDDGSDAIAKNRKKNKKNRTTTTTTTSSSSSSSSSSISPVTYTFNADEDDHCESPLSAYGDLLPLLSLMTKRLGKTRDTVVIYDPYYCAGSVVDNLGALGYGNVINRNRDFYLDVENKEVPPHDIMITNPPYSSDHVEKLCAYCATSSTPFFLLMPNWVYVKDYYKRLLGDAGLCLLVGNDGKRYKYESPKGSRAKTGIQRITSPFPSFWYCWFGTQHWKTIKVAQKAVAESETKRKRKRGDDGGDGGSGALSFYRDSAALPQALKDSYDRTRKRKRKKQRDAAKRQQEAGSGGGAVGGGHKKKR